MTESHSLDVPEPSETMRQKAAEDLKKCWAQGTGVHVGQEGRLNEQLLGSLDDLRELVEHVLADKTIDVTQSRVLYTILRSIHPPDPEPEERLEGAPRKYLENQDTGTRKLMAWAIGALMRIDKRYPLRAVTAKSGPGRRELIAEVLGMQNSYQLNEPKTESDKSSKSLDVFREAYIDYLIEQLANPEVRDRVVRIARAKMQESAVRKPTADAPVTPLRPATPAPQVDDSAEADTLASARDTEAEEGGTTGKAGAETGWTRYWKHLAAFGAVVALVIGGTIIFVHRGAGNGHTSTVAGSTTSSVAPAPPGVSLSPNNLCDRSTPAASVTEPDVDICVIYWCMGSFHAANGVDWIPNRAQIKMRPLIFNRSSHAVDISITPNAALRLLVSTPDDPRDWWQPPSETAKQGDHPNVVSRKGEVLWAVPPNKTGDAVRIDFPDGSYTYDGFATFWDYTSLDPGQTAFKPLRFKPDRNPFQEGDLVFDVPLDDKSRVLGLALVDRNDPSRVLAVSDADTWPARSDLNSF
ncbi:hypothetical protein ACWDXV_32460 [Nocardia nova]